MSRLLVIADSVPAESAMSNDGKTAIAILAVILILFFLFTGGGGKR